MNYFDLHCDTPYVLYRKSTKFDENSHHVSLNKTEKTFEAYAQFAAYCASPRKSDAEAFDTYVKSTDCFFSEMNRLKDRASICTSFAGLEKAVSEGKAAIFPTVEDARILENDISRLDFLYGRGCRILTLVWGGTSCIGGAHNTDTGLTDFGKETAERCFEIGIVPDISHSSEKSVDDLLEIAEKHNKPIIATHSNSYEVFSHTRNLRDRHFTRLASLGGIVGVSLCDSHLCPDKENADIDAVIRHIDHYLSLGGEDCISLGCDLDGCDLAKGVADVSDIPKIFERMSSLGYSDEIIEKISYKNAYNFVKRNFKK